MDIDMNSEIQKIAADIVKEHFHTMMKIYERKIKKSFGKIPNLEFCMGLFTMGVCFLGSLIETLCDMNATYNREEMCDIFNDILKNTMKSVGSRLNGPLH